LKQVTHNSEPDTSPHRIVLLGASNLTFALRNTLAGVMARTQGPVEIYAAWGPGRSYGLQAGMPFLKFAGINRCGMWQALDEAQQQRPGAKLHALLTDVGNDLLYTGDTRLVLRWVETCVNRLREMGADVGITAPPVSSVVRLGPLRYLALRSLFFPRSRMSRQQAFQLLGRLQDGLGRMAEQPGVNLLPVERDWYGLDRFHIKRGQRSKVFHQWLDELLERPIAQSEGVGLSLAGIRKQRDWFFGRERHTPQAGYELNERTLLYAY